MTRAKFELIKGVPVQDLKLDTSNARIRHGADQSDCIARILRKEDQILALMRDIGEHGLSTAPILVSPDSNGKWVVRDGNRRMTALKLLDNPGYCADLRLRAQIEAVAAKYSNFPKVVDLLACGDEKVVRREMLLRHSGALGGVGQLSWSAYLRTVFLLNGDGSEPDPYRRAGQYVYWAEDQGAYVDDDFPISNLDRFFNKDTLELLGFEASGKELVRIIPFDDAKRLALRVVGDLDAKRVDVNDLFTADAYRAYLLRVRKELGIEKAPGSSAGGNGGFADKGNDAGSRGSSGGSGRGHGGGDAKEGSQDNGDPNAEPKPGKGGGTGTPGGRGTPRKAPWDRTRIFPRGYGGFSISRDQIKAGSIIAEMKRLDVTAMPFSGCFLLRTLIELSVNNYLEVYGLADRKALHKNVGLVAHDMHSRKLIGDGLLEVVQRHANSEGGLLSVRGLQGYIHSPDFHPNYQFVNTMWDEIGQFVGLCWQPKQ
jgi:hypothetical protein